MNMKEIEKYGPDFMYFEEPDTPINNGFFEHLQNLTESMTRVRKVIDIRSNYISKEPQEIVNQVFDNNSERINNWLNRDFATDNLVDKGNLGKVSAIDWNIIKHRVSYFIRKQSKCNDVIANLSAEEKETLCRILSEDIYSYHEEYKNKKEN